MKLVYIAGPISSDCEYTKTVNCLKAGHVAVQLIKMGLAVHCPHVMHWAPHAYDITWEQYLDMDFCIIRKCDAVFMLPGWRESDGARAEHSFAKDQGIPIFYDMQTLKTWSDRFADDADLRSSRQAQQPDAQHPSESSDPGPPDELPPGPPWQRPQQ